MEQGRAREATAAPTGTPAAQPHTAADVSRVSHVSRVPGQAAGPPAERAAGPVAERARPVSEPSRPGRGQARSVPEQARAVRGEHTHSEPPAPGAAPRSVQRHSVRGQVLDALRAALVGGDLVPGEVYSAPALGLRLGVSATPVREAMLQLAIEGAVEVVPNRGFRVIERSLREVAELAEVRALIEVPVMLRLASTVPPARWAELRPLAEATATAAARGDLASYGEADRAFHRALLGLAGNEQLVAVADDLHRRSQWPLVNPLALRRADLLADAAEHGALLDALEAGDVAVVESLVREHFTGAAT